MALFAEQAKEVDVIITTAMIPGKAAPRLILTEHVDSMKAGACAAGWGGQLSKCVDQEAKITETH